MKIAVCIKQVPAGQQTIMDPEKGVLVRIAAESMLNPYDGYAIEAALQIAARTGGEVTAISMGPASAQAVLREALAMGVQQAALLCDSAFAGADVYATAFTLAAGMQTLGGFDAVVCGQQTTDGDTAQVPYSLAAQLDVPAIGWVTEIASADAMGFALRQEITGGEQMVSGTWPAVIAVSRDCCQMRMPTLMSRLQAQQKAIQTLSLSDMPLPQGKYYGLSGSPTRVKKIFAPDTRYLAQPVAGTPAEIARLMQLELQQEVAP